MIIKATNQVSQLVVFPNTFVGGYPWGNPFGNNSATGCKNYCKKLKTCSKHVTFCKVGPCKELSLKNHVSRARTHNNNDSCKNSQVFHKLWKCLNQQKLRIHWRWTYYHKFHSQWPELRQLPQGKLCIIHPCKVSDEKKNSKPSLMLKQFYYSCNQIQSCIFFCMQPKFWSNLF